MKFDLDLMIKIQNNTEDFYASKKKTMMRLLAQNYIGEYNSPEISDILV